MATLSLQRFSFGSPHPPTGDLRDSMLKEPDSSPVPPPRPPPPQFYDGMFDSPESYNQQPRIDTDLDEEVRRGNMEIVFGNRGHMSSEELLRPYAYPRGEDGQPVGRAFKSVTVRTYRSADGKVEERHTIQDGRGNEETTIVRKLDDREHTVTKKRDYTGGEQVEEHFKNMDKDDKDEFNRMWRIRRGPPNKDIMHKDPGVIDKETKSIFRNLFGQSFPGFPTDLS